MSVFSLVPAPLKRMCRLATSLSGGNPINVAVEEGTLQKSLLRISQKPCVAKQPHALGMASLMMSVGVVALLLGAACCLSLARGVPKIADVNSPPPLYHIFANNPYDAGLQHGHFARARIHGWFATAEMKHRFKWASQAGTATFEQLKKDNKKEFPVYIEEMQGIADGAEVTMDQIWVANLINEIDSLISHDHRATFTLPWEMTHCSDEYAMSPSGFESGFAHGHNDDWSQVAASFLYFLAVSPLPGAEAIVSRCAGLVYPGSLVGWSATWNSHGTFSTQNTLLPMVTRPSGLGCVFIQRRAICDTKSMSDALVALTRPGWSSGASLNVIHLGEKRMANVEAWMDSHSVLEVTPAMGNYSHFNEYKHLGMASGARIDDPLSFISDPRQGRSDELPPVGNAGDIRVRLSDPLIYRNTTLLTTILNGSTGMLDVWCGVPASHSPPHYSWSLPSFFMNVN